MCTIVAGLFFNIFNLQLGESADAKPTDTESQIYLFHQWPFAYIGQCGTSGVDNLVLSLSEHSPKVAFTPCSGSLLVTCLSNGALLSLSPAVCPHSQYLKCPTTTTIFYPRCPHLQGTVGSQAHSKSSQDKPRTPSEGQIYTEARNSNQYFKLKQAMLYYKAKYKM